MDNKNEVFEYHKMVRGMAKEETKSYYRKSFQDWGGDVLAAGFTAIASALYFYFRNGMEIDWINILVSIAIGFVAVIVFRFTHNVLWVVPAKLYRAKEIEANKFTWNDVSITIPEMPTNNPLPASLHIINNKPYRIEKATVEVKFIKKGRVLLETYNTLPLHLGWADNEGEIWDGRTLDKNDDDGKIIAVANWLLEDKGVFLLATNSEKIMKGRADFIELEMNVIYTIQLEWSGEVEERVLDKLINWYSLRFDENKIYLEEVK